MLFLCSQNAVRSPMAAALLGALAGRRVHIRSAGVRCGASDGFVIAVMQELGIDLARHSPTPMADIALEEFDLIVTLSPEAHHRALDETRAAAVEVEYWPTPDPTVTDGLREERLAAYRSVRDQLEQRIRTRFLSGTAPVV
ncbi:MAG: low molecular weight phosphatase family protein [Alphaproteobacteria bacterium]|nr:MAG: low molecular weight phosphatase family protein [Alphaproteobacteria bacterium]